MTHSRLNMNLMLEWLHDRAADEQIPPSYPEIAKRFDLADVQSAKGLVADLADAGAIRTKPVGDDGFKFEFIGLGVIKERAKIQSLGVRSLDSMPKTERPGIAVLKAIQAGITARRDAEVDDLELPEFPCGCPATDSNTVLAGNLKIPTCLKCRGAAIQAGHARNKPQVVAAPQPLPALCETISATPAKFDVFQSELDNTITIAATAPPKPVAIAPMDAFTAPMVPNFAAHEVRERKPAVTVPAYAILAKVTDYLERTGMSASTFGKEAFRDKSFMSRRLRMGAKVHTGTVEKIEAFMAAFPDGVEKLKPHARTVRASEVGVLRILEEVDAFCALHGMASTRFGSDAVKDGNIVRMLREGRKPLTEAMAARLRGFMAGYVPPAAPAKPVAKVATPDGTRIRLKGRIHALWHKHGGGASYAEFVEGLIDRGIAAAGYAA